jgi:hypothetical protein
MQFRQENTNWRLVHRYVAWLLVATWLSTGIGATAHANNLADAEVAVEAAGDSLSSSPQPPWYDRQTDDFRPTEVRQPRARTIRNTNSSLSEWLLRLGWILLAALMVYLVYLLARAFLNQEVGGSMIVKQQAAGGEVLRVSALPVALSTSPGDFLDEARRLYGRGDYNMAIVYLFSHQLLQLDRRHWVRLVKGKTNRQYLREVRHAASPNAAQLATMFQATVLLFEEVFFGKRLPPREHVDRVWGDIDQFEALVAPAEAEAA